MIDQVTGAVTDLNTVIPIDFHPHYIQLSDITNALYTGNNVVVSVVN